MGSCRGTNNALRENELVSHGQMRKRLQNRSTACAIRITIVLVNALGKTP